MSANEVEQIKELAIAAIGERHLEALGEPGVILPADYRVELLDQYKDRPRLIRHAAVVNHIDSFIAYMKLYSNEFSIVFGNINESNAFEGVIDYHDLEGARHCQHLAGLENIFTPEWEAWKLHSGTKMTQRQMREWIEDHVEHIGKPDSAMLIDAISNVQTRTYGVTRASISSDQESVGNEATLQLDTSFPMVIDLVLKPYEFSDPFVVKARLSLHSADSDVKFSYKLIRPETVLQQIFNEQRAKIEAETGLKVYV